MADSKYSSLLYLILIHYLSRKANRGVLFVRPLAIDDVDSIIHAHHLSLKSRGEKEEEVVEAVVA
jgi:hypothetical protein